MKVSIMIQNKEYFIIESEGCLGYEAITEKINKKNETVKQFHGHFLTLFGVMNYIFNLKIQTSDITTLKELLDLIKITKQELQNTYNTEIEKEEK